MVRGGLSLGVVRWTGRLAAMAPDKDNTKPVKRRAEIVAEKRAAALAAFQRGPAKNMDEAQVSIVEFRALRVEASRLLRENTRLTHEVTARADGSYASLQVTNARLVREVARLQQDLGRAGRQVDQLRERLSGTAVAADMVDAEVQCERTYVSSIAFDKSSPVMRRPSSQLSSRTSEGQESERDHDDTQQHVSPPNRRVSSDSLDLANAGSPEGDELADGSAPPSPDPGAADASFRKSEHGDDEADGEIVIRGPGLPPIVTAHMQSVWSEHGGDLVEPFIRSGAFVLVDAQWIIGRSDYYHKTKAKLLEDVTSLRNKVDSIRGSGEYAQRQSDAAKSELAQKEEALNYCLENDTLPRRNDLPPSAIFGLEVLKASGCPNGGLPIIVISCPWLSPYHPDPKGYNLAFMASVLKPFVAGGQRYGVFWDWTSMYQGEGRSDPLTNAQNESVARALQGLSVLYTHEYTTVIRMTCHPPDFPEAYDPLPAGANIAEYSLRGWTYTEALWASWPNKKTLDLAKLAKMRKENRMPTELRELLRLCAHSDMHKAPPLLLEQYKEELLQKTMYNAKDDFPLLLELYEAAFKTYYGQAYKLNFTNLGWADDQVMQLARILSSGIAKRLVLIHLALNQIGDQGLMALASAITSGAMPQLSMIVLQGNPGDHTIVHKALESRAKERVTRRHSRKLSRPNTDAPESPGGQVETPTVVIATPQPKTPGSVLRAHAHPRSPVRLIGSPWMQHRRQGPTSLTSQGYLHI